MVCSPVAVRLRSAACATDMGDRAHRPAVSRSTRQRNPRWSSRTPFCTTVPARNQRRLQSAHCKYAFSQLHTADPSHLPLDMLRVQVLIEMCLCCGETEPACCLERRTGGSPTS
eukprot:2800025-Rhodomonas_salina.2